MTLTDDPPIPTPTRDEYESFLKRVEQMATAGQADAGRSMVNYGSILYLTQERMGKAQPVSDQARSVAHPAVRVLSLVLVGLSALCVSASPRTKVRPVTAIDTRAASAAILAGKAAMQRYDYREAVDHFQDAGTRGADPEAWLPGMIECRLAVGQYGLAESLCAELANANPRNQSLVPYFRGACLYGQGRKDAARAEYAEARKLGHPGGADALRTMGAK